MHVSGVTSQAGSVIIPGNSGYSKRVHSDLRRGRAMTQALFIEFQNQAMPPPAQSAWEDSEVLRAVTSPSMTVQLLRSHSSLSNSDATYL